MSQKCNTLFRIKLFTVLIIYSMHHLLKGNKMDFDCAVKIINKLLMEKRPDTFSSSWIRHNAPSVYRFIQRNVRTEVGGIDWDRITRALDRRLQKKWAPSSNHRKRSYRSKAEVGIILQKYNKKFYTFISPRDKNDDHTRDIISISLVRIAQKGNITAKEKIMDLVMFTVKDWIESRPTLSSWEGHEFLIPRLIEACIRCYRYSGTFIGYLLKTLEYAGRGLRTTHEYAENNL